MSLTEQIQKDMVDAMRAKQELRLSVLRMMKSAIKNKEIDKRGALDDKEVVQVLSTMVKQRRDSIDQFTKGNRPELAAKEADEIKLIEAYMPKAASEDDVRSTVRTVITEMGSPTAKDMGTVMKNTMAKFAASGVRAEGKTVSEIVKQELAGR
jgi:uncharacterized protein YqeY